MPDEFDDGVLGALKVPMQELNEREGQTTRFLLGGDKVLGLECLLNGFTNLGRCCGVDGRVADVEGGEGARVST